MWNFVNKLAESFLFLVFPLIFSRKSIILWRNSKLMDAMLIGPIMQMNLPANEMFFRL